MKQTVLNFATKIPTSTQVIDRIIGGVCPLIATRETNTSTKEEDKQIICKFKLKPGAFFCNGLLAKKYLNDISVQGGIKSLTKYCKLADNFEYKFGVVHGTISVQSIFNVDCTGSTGTVR